MLVHLISFECLCQITKIPMNYTRTNTKITLEIVWKMMRIFSSAEEEKYPDDVYRLKQMGKKNWMCVKQNNSEM